MPAQSLANKVSGKPVPLLKSHASVRQFKLAKDGQEESTGDLHQWFKRKQSVWPVDAANIHNEKDGMAEVAQILTTHDPQAPSNLVEFSFKDKSFIPVVQLPKNINLLEIEGSCLHIETPEARNQLADGMPTSLEAKVVSDDVGDTQDDSTNDISKAGDDDDSIEEIEEDENKDVKFEKSDLTPVVGTGKPKKLMNQFNFCERGTITYENSLKETGTVTKPPIRITFSDYVTQWIIYDSYQEDSKRQEQEKEKNKKEKVATATTKKIDFLKETRIDKKDLMNTNIVKKALILERMINQNMFNDILHDFRYYEDPSDEYRNNEGTLLPLWKLQYPMFKKLTVTDIKWNPRYYDMIAVSFGTFDLQKQNPKGSFCLWSLKNPSIPEFIIHTRSAVLTLDLHPTKPLIVIGMHNGMVAVYDCRLSNKPPIYESDCPENKHKGFVRQVQWGDDLTEGESTFFSVSSDGNVFNWILMQNKLIHNLVISLTHHTANGESKQSLKDAGTCIALHPVDRSIFLVGTDEGYIYKCSTAYLSMYLFVYDAHLMPVYTIDYNKYSPSIFASCGADWTVKVWEDERKEPLFILDTHSSMEDVKWAPYSSTVLAAVSQDCKTHVYDLNVNKYKSICEQTISSRKTSQLTRIAFNWKLPIIVVGDDKGIASVLKLSPNLRVKSKLTKKQFGINLEEVELKKLNKLLSLIREPSEMKNFQAPSNTDTTSL